MLAGERYSLGNDSSILSNDVGPESQKERYSSERANQVKRQIEAFMAGESLPEKISHRLDLLCDVANALGLEDSTFYSFATATSRLCSDESSLASSINHLSIVAEDLQSGLASMRYEQRLLDEWTSKLEELNQPGNPESKANLERRHLALNKKAKEYRAQLNALLAEREGPAVTVTDVLELQDDVKAKQQAIDAKRAKIEAFKGLPPNMALARHELRNAREEQIKLFNLREKLLRRMASGVA